MYVCILEFLPIEELQSLGGLVFSFYFQNKLGFVDVYRSGLQPAVITFLKTFFQALV